MEDFLQLPASIRVVDVATEHSLQQFRTHCIDNASIACMDAEWTPNKRVAGATLLQVAVRDDAVNTPWTTIVYLLDLLALERIKHTGSILQEILQCTTLLKVGYGMYHDLGALAARIGGCCTTAHPQLDIMHALVHMEHALPRSLSAACAALLGRPLDKTQQCSAWAQRPLTDAQRQYAALDAYCLLMLYDCVQERASLSSIQLPIHRLRWPEGPMLPKGNTNSTTSIPFAIPWLEVADATPRFVCDVMLEGLARQLRLCGVDAASVCAAGHPRRRVHRMLVEAAESQRRVILTKDQTLHRARYCDAVWLVHSQHRHAQLNEVLKEFQVRVGAQDILSRCAKCNGELLEEMFSRETVPIQARVHLPPMGVGEDGIWVCGQCYKCYWQGVQYARARVHLKERLQGGVGERVLTGVGL